jgi:hypothetical protein
MAMSDFDDAARLFRRFGFDVEMEFDKEGSYLYFWLKGNKQVCLTFDPKTGRFEELELG